MKIAEDVDMALNKNKPLLLDRSHPEKMIKIHVKIIELHKTIWRLEQNITIHKKNNYHM